MKEFHEVVVGYGGMGRHHAIHVPKPEGRLKVTGVYDIDPERMRVAMEDGIPKAYASYEEVLADKDVDILAIAVPNNFHKDMVIAGLRAGKAVICEKPVAMNSAELEEMMAVAKETGSVFTIHQNRRTDADYVLMRESVEKGLIGNVFKIESRVNGSRGIPQGWRQYAVAGGGMMLDWGVHLIDQLMYMYLDKKVTSIYCNMYHVAFKECDDGFMLTMKFEDGLTAHIEVGTSHYIVGPRWYVCGDRGALQIDDWNCNGRIIRAKDRQVVWEEEIVQTKAGPTKTMAPRPKETVEEIVFNPDLYESDRTWVYRNLCDVIEGKDELIVKPEQAMRVMKVMEACFKSDKTGDVVHCNI